MSQPHVVILGGGFGGLAVARGLAKSPVRITLLDRRNHHLFQPLLYQVATAALNPADIAYPIRAALRRAKNTRVLLGAAESIDRGTKTVRIENGSVAYDYLVIATGATHSYFAHDEWRRYAPGLKTVDDALEIRRRTLFAYEAAERETDAERQHAWLTFVVVGGGPTGVELAGALSEIGRKTVAKDFRAIDPTLVRVILVEGKERVLPGYPEDLSAKALTQLQRLGVDVRLNAIATDIDGHGIELGDEKIAARTVLWAAGVEASPLAMSLETPLDSSGRVKVRPDLTVDGDDDVFVIGDLMSLSSGGKPVPGVAPAAAQAGKQTAKNIKRRLKGTPSAAFRYVDKGSLATVGRSKAVADLGKLRFSGFFAWVFWWLVHVMFLVSFRNRFVVLFSWAWSYVTFQRGARLITGETQRLPDYRDGTGSQDPDP